MSGLDSDILREKIRQKMPKPPNFSFGLKAFLAIAIVSLILLGLVGGSFIAVIPAGTRRSAGPIRSGFRYRVEPWIQF